MKDKLFYCYTCQSFKMFKAKESKYVCWGCQEIFKEDVEGVKYG